MTDRNAELMYNQESPVKERKKRKKRRHLAGPQRPQWLGALEPHDLKWVDFLGIVCAGSFRLALHHSSDLT